MPNVAASVGAQSAASLGPVESKAASDNFKAALQQAKSSGGSAETNPSGNREAGASPQGHAPQENKPANADQPELPSSQASAKETKDFVKSIDQAGNGAGVAKTLTTASKDGDINQVLATMSPSQLNTAAKKLNQYPPDLSQQQLAAMCKAIVSGGASGKNLAKLTNAFNSNPRNSAASLGLGQPFLGAQPPPLDLGGTLASSIASGAPADTRVAYIGALKSQIGTNSDVANEVGVTLATLKGNDVNQAVGGLDGSQLHAVLTASLGKSFAGIVDAAATQGVSAKTRASVFQQATQAFTTFYPGGHWQTGAPDLGVPLPSEKAAMDSRDKQDLGALTKLLDQDPEGTISQLRLQDNNGANTPGQALTTYITAEIGRGNTTTLSRLFDQLKFGPLTADGHRDATYADQAPANADAPSRAGTLGYFVGAYQQAIANSSHDPSGSSVLAGLVSVLGISPESTLAGGAITTWVGWVHNKSLSQNIDAQDALYWAATKDASNKGTDELPTGGNGTYNAYSAFQEGLNNVNPTYARPA